MHVMSISAHTKNMCHSFMCVFSSATEMLSKLCICTAGELLEDFTAQIFSACAQLHTFLTHNCSIMIIHTHAYSLTSSSSENLHELLSSVIILERVQIAESTSMLCVVSTA